MSEKKFSYYQYRQNLGYSIFVRFEEAEFEKKFVDALTLVGFDPVGRDEVKNIELNPNETRILRVVKATNKISKKINAPEFGDHRYGPEQVTQSGAYSVYCYQKVAMMVYSQTTPMWELGIKDVSDPVALRTIFIRFLSFAFSGLGVVGFWSVPIDEGIVVLSPKESNYEAIFVDLKKQVLLTFEGVKDLTSDTQVLRLDQTLISEMRQLKAEQLLSFLSMRTTFISPMGMKSVLRSDIWELAQLVTGYTYPADKFQPRSASEAA